MEQEFDPLDPPAITTEDFENVTFISTPATYDKTQFQEHEIKFIHGKDDRILEWIPSNIEGAFNEDSHRKMMHREFWLLKADPEKHGLDLNGVYYNDKIIFWQYVFLPNLYGRITGNLKRNNLTNIPFMRRVIFRNSPGIPISGKAFHWERENNEGLPRYQYYWFNTLEPDNVELTLVNTSTANYNTKEELLKKCKAALNTLFQNLIKKGQDGLSHVRTVNSDLLWTSIHRLSTLLEAMFHSGL